MKKEIEIIISPEGEITFQIKGLKRQECLDLTKLLEESLGDVKERKATAKYYEREAYITDKAKISRKS